MSTEAVDFDPTPNQGAVWQTGIAAVVAVGAVAVTLAATVVGLAGTIVMVYGVSRGSRFVHTLGSMALFGGVLVAGLQGASPVIVVAGAAATVVAWDAGENGISLGRQLGHAAETRRAAVVHLGATTVVAVVVAVVAVVSFRMARRGQSTLASLLLLVAAITFIWLLDR